MAAVRPAIKGAATVVICRETGAGAGLFRCLMVKRSATARFFPGYSVFPGGILEPEDSLPARDFSGQTAQFMCPRGEVLGERTSTGELHSVNVNFDQAQQEPPGELSSAAPNELVQEVALRRCGIREVFEETGLLFVTDSFAHVAERVSRDNKETMESWRKATQQDASKFSHLCQSAGVEPDIDVLYPFDWWLTPRGEKSKWRYNTMFYVAIVRAGDDRGAALWDEHETQGFMWVSPREALDGCAAGLVKMAPPTFLNLHRLAQFATIDDLESALQTREFSRTTLSAPTVPVFASADDEPDGGALFASYLAGDERNPTWPGPKGAIRRIVGTPTQQGGVTYTLREENLDGLSRL